jgi:hypothetical protein
MNVTVLAQVKYTRSLVFARTGRGCKCTLPPELWRSAFKHHRIRDESIFVDQPRSSDVARPKCWPHITMFLPGARFSASTSSTGSVVTIRHSGHVPIVDGAHRHEREHRLTNNRPGIESGPPFR